MPADRGRFEHKNEDVYSTHYVIGQQVFSALDDLLDYIKPYPPDRFPMVSLKECSARAKAEELLAAKAENERGCKNMRSSRKPSPPLPSCYR